LVVFTVAGGFLSFTDAYNWVNQTQVEVPTEQAVNHIASNILGNQTVAVVCQLNRFNQYMVRYYLNVKDPDLDFNRVWQYPAEAVDAYTPNFNISEFTLMCQQRETKYVLLYESNGTPYFNTNLTAPSVYNILSKEGSFVFEATYGMQPNRIFEFSIEP
jgi:hypothetical protein